MSMEKLGRDMKWAADMEKWSFVSFFAGLGGLGLGGFLWISAMGSSTFLTVCIAFGILSLVAAILLQISAKRLSREAREKYLR
jgi:hypothetical protein